MNDERFFIERGQKNRWNLVERTRSDQILLMKSEYKKYWHMIDAGENFMFLRYGDGERLLMLGREIRAQEGWSSPKGLTELGRDLLKPLQIPPSEESRSKIIYAVSCPCCDAESYFWYLRHLPPQANVTFSNLWINANFVDFQRDFQHLTRDAVLITNYRGKDKSFGRLNVIKHYLVDDDCVNFWRSKGQTFVRQIIDEVGDRNDLLYCFAAGPLSEVIMLELFKHNPNNCYIDFGSALDLIIHGRATRPYMNESHPYAHQECWTFDNARLDLDIDVVLTTYKRPQLLSQQLDAVRSQTVAPKDIFLFQDGIDSYYEVNLKRDILEQFDGNRISSSNVGVWGRFEYAAKVTRSHYVCILDDDTIPGARWFENCLVHMLQQRGVYGTNGILLRDPRNYSYASNPLNPGWHVANERVVEADFVGHSWFIEREYLDWMLRKPYAQKYKYVGEDMCLSFACQEHGIATFVPDHPLSDESLWGSLPRLGYKYGTSEVAVSLDPVNIKMMNAVLSEMHADGWKALSVRDPQYVKRITPEVTRHNIMGQLSGTVPKEADLKLRRAAKILLSLIDKKNPVFFVERKYVEAIKKIFALRDRDCIVLDEIKNRINVDDISKNLKKYAVHMFFTDAYDSLKPYVERTGFRENEDFFDGRGFLILNE